MATLTIRDLDDALKLRMRAASRNRSMEEARQILRAALTEAERPQEADRSVGLSVLRRSTAPSTS
jgi:plasmid stability protein